MGLIRQGILGGFRKKTGTVVGAFWRKLDVIRALPRSSGKAPTQAQLNQQMKFGLVTGFLSNMSSLLDEGFKVANSISTPMNLAVSYHLKEAITGVEPNFEIDFAKVKFSNGKLDLPMEILVNAIAGGSIELTWPHTEEDDKFIDGTDLLNVLVYNPVKQKFVKLKTAVTRSLMTFVVALPSNFVGDEVHVYASFGSVRQKLLQSNSLYVGPVTII